jgi:hypothetical protein
MKGRFIWQVGPWEIPAENEWFYDPFRNNLYQAQEGAWLKFFPNHQYSCTGYFTVTGTCPPSPSLAPAHLSGFPGFKVFHGCSRLTTRQKSSSFRQILKELPIALGWHFQDFSNSSAGHTTIIIGIQSQEAIAMNDRS